MQAKPKLDVDVTRHCWGLCGFEILAADGEVIAIVPLAYRKAPATMEDNLAHPENLARAEWAKEIVRCVNRQPIEADLLAALKVAKQFFINPGSFNPLDVERMYDAAIARAEEV